MKRLRTVVLVLTGFTAGIVFVYSCGGGSSSQSGNLTWPSPVAATGQTVSYADSDDGALQMGVIYPSSRFTNNGDGTLTDNLTGLEWLKNANCFGTRTWTQALSDSNGLASGSCGLTDGSVTGDWRLPNVNELASIIDFGQAPRTLPPGYSFTGVQWDPYFTSSTVSVNTGAVWVIQFTYGHTIAGSKTAAYYVWPVRGGV